MQRFFLLCLFACGYVNDTIAQVANESNVPATGESMASPPTVCFFQTSVNKPAVKCYVTKTRSQRNTDWGSPDKYNNPGYYKTENYDENHAAMRVDPYDLYTGHLNLGAVQEQEYKSNGQPLTTTTKYYYSPLNYQISSMTKTQSDHGNTTEKRFRYSGNNVGAGIVNLLNQQNMMSVLVSEESSIGNNPTYNGVLGNSTNEFVQLANGDLKPSKTSIVRYAAPGNAVGAVTDVQTFQYDNAGNMTGVKDDAGRSVAYIYDYDDKYITASVINADATVDKPAYCGFETEALGGWAITGTPVYTTAQSFTGIRALQLSSSLSAPINPAKQYIVSFWAANNLSVSGATPGKSGPTLNGFTYYEYLTQNSSSVSVSGSGIIDELRLYPKMARMSTVSYDPLIGKISECDANNRVTYYEYDERGRIRYIRDEHKNVVKIYQYQNTATAPARTYYNHAISETFTANTCQGDYVGKEITYTIPENKYSSGISQADADAKAQEELNNDGQAAANNAGCDPIFYNDEQSQQFQKEDCAVGYKGTLVTYTVPARRYFSKVSKEDANNMALEELEANGDAFANDPANGACLVDPDPQWEADEPAQERCGTGATAGHREVYMKDVNPNTPTYNTWQWRDIGIDEEGCPASYNLITNGDFEQGETGFESEYDILPSGTLTSQGDCSVTTNPYTSNHGWCITGDHTSGSGKMLVVDGDNMDPYNRFWYTAVDVQPNTTYVLSFWCMTLYATSAYLPAIIQVNINGGNILFQRLSATTCGWQQLQVTWNSGNSTTANLDFIAPAGNPYGNDFAMDDISFLKQ